MQFSWVTRVNQIRDGYKAGEFDGSEDWESYTQRLELATELLCGANLWIRSTEF